MEAMQTTVAVGNTELPLSLQPATVIHSNKFSEARGGGFNLPVISTLYTEVVYRMKDTQADVKLYLRNRNLPIYTNQEVSLISSSGKLIGFIDVKTNQYYYTSSDLSRHLGMAIPYYWVLIFSVAGAALIYFLYPEGRGPLMAAPALIALLFYWIYKYLTNRRITQAVDAYMVS
ncbi:MAG: hypothetical protein JWQ27_1826 [Ferruginibacter sp.]|nr:hypothetical protein [Ferruginibacter sp.]